MIFPFNPAGKLIFVEAVIVGPGGAADAVLALDTGASVSVINPVTLAVAGYGSASVQSGGTVTTASGSVPARRVRLGKLRALGREATGLVVLAHQLPSAAKYDGLLGLDFLRGGELMIDFRLGFVRLA